MSNFKKTLSDFCKFLYSKPASESIPDSIVMLELGYDPIKWGRVGPTLKRLVKYAPLQQKLGIKAGNLNYTGSKEILGKFKDFLKHHGFTHELDGKDIFTIISQCNATFDKKQRMWKWKPLPKQYFLKETEIPTEFESLFIVTKDKTFTIFE